MCAIESNYERGVEMLRETQAYLDLDGELCLDTV